MKIKPGVACNASTLLHQGNGDKLERSLQNYISCHGSPIEAATHEKCHWGPGIVILDSGQAAFLLHLNRANEGQPAANMYTSEMMKYFMWQVKWEVQCHAYGHTVLKWFCVLWQQS